MKHADRVDVVLDTYLSDSWRLRPEAKEEASEEEESVDELGNLAPFLGIGKTSINPWKQDWIVLLPG